jgi:hypothetical protein
MDQVKPKYFSKGFPEQPKGGRFLAIFRISYGPGFVGGVKVAVRETITDTW